MKMNVKKCTKHIAKISLIALFVLSFSGCRVSDIQEISIDIHDAKIENPSCLKTMEEAIKTLPGKEHVIVKALPEENAISVTYDAMAVGRKNLEDALAQKGFDAGNYKANESARSTLPSDWFSK